MRLMSAALIGAFLVSCGVGCIGFGPKNNRLYQSEWKAKRDHPIQLEEGWQYEGEYMEHTKRVDRKRNRDRNW